MLSPEFLCADLLSIQSISWKPFGRELLTRGQQKKTLKILLFKLSETARIKRSCRHVSAIFGAVCLCHQSSLNNFSFRYFPVRPRAMRCSSHKCISIALVAPKVFHFGYIQHYASHLTWEAIVIKYIRLIFLGKDSQVEIQFRRTPWQCWIIADQKSFEIWKSQKHGMLKAFRVYEIFSSDNLKIIKLHNLKSGEPKYLKFDIF